MSLTPRNAEVRSNMRNLFSTTKEQIFRTERKEIYAYVVEIEAR
jgi:hypothetical protein